jgi:MoaA/NifB/PqqE/SkfB family radical SAM enzyme
MKHFFKKKFPSLDWIQVEISSYCNGECIYCPHTTYKKNWQDRLLPLEMFQSLVPAFPKTNFIHLQGWGEPFINPHFGEMLKIAKHAGCMVGTTTNGTLIDDEIIRMLVDEHLDIIGFSLAGVDEKNDVIRKGTQIEKVLESIGKIERIKNEYGVDRPIIHIAYMLLRSGLADLEKIPDLFKNTGVSKVVISSLSLITHEAMKNESVLYSSEEEFFELKKRLSSTRDASREYGIDVGFNLVSPRMNKSFCSENITRAIVVGSDGRVSPCVMSNIPLKRESYYYFNGQKRKLKDLAFGNISKEPINTIWFGEEYGRFLRLFKKDEVPYICRNCYKRYIDNLESEG